MKFFSGIGERLREGLKRSQEYLSTGLSTVLEPDRPIDESLWEELEELLISADLGAAMAALEAWGQRIDVEVVRQAAGSDPAAVVFDALKSAMARGADVLVIDTAGRLHTKSNLMDELAKLKRVIERQVPGAPHEALMVLDAPTGQNGFAQAKMFHETIGLTGVALTKLDGTAKGGIVVRIVRELGLPVTLVGVGEKIEDLQAFDATQFVDALVPA